jgi:hypothetical protein
MEEDMLWKPTPAEKKALRSYAAKHEKRRPGQLHIEIGVRHNTETDRGNSVNIMQVTDLPDWDDTDLYDTRGWCDLNYGVPLTRAGRAVVDFYVYEKAFGDHGDLMTNIQAHVALKDGKPVLWKITGTLMPMQIEDADVAATLAGDPVGIDG